MIDKFAIAEAKCLMRQHSQLIFNWANEDKSRYTTEENKDCLKALCARMYELIDALPVHEVPTTTDPETGEEVNING